MSSPASINTPERAAVFTCRAFANSSGLGVVPSVVLKLKGLRLSLGFGLSHPNPSQMLRDSDNLQSSLLLFFHHTSLESKNTLTTAGL